MSKTKSAKPDTNVSFRTSIGGQALIEGILDNAAKYARDGKTIEVSVFSDSEAATIQFRDHGPGIPENELPHVKEKFFKGEKHKARGSGIGLAVCDEIITRSGGTLTIANAPGGGTLVSVRLPFAPESGN